MFKSIDNALDKSQASKPDITTRPIPAIHSLHAFSPEKNQRKGWRKSWQKLAGISLFLALCLPISALAAVDLVINVTDTPDPVPAGGVVTYNISIENNGDTGATNVQSTYTIPAGGTYLGFTGAGVSCTPAPSAGPIICSHPDLAGTVPGPPGNSTFAIQLRTSVPNTSTFKLGATTTFNGTDGNELNNTEIEQTTVNASANFKVTKTPETGNAQSGSSFSWTLGVTNAGPEPASHLRIQDPIPTGFSVTSLPGGCVNNAGTIICDIAGPIASGGSLSIGSVTGVITAAGGSTVTNTATVALSPSATAADADDPDTGDNTAISNIVIAAGSDLKIVKTRSVAGNFLVGATFNFVLNPSYTGDSPNTLTVQDVIPSNYTIGVVAASQNGWTCGVAGQIVTCTKPSGGVAGLNQSLGNITIPVTVASAGNNISNTAEISAASPTDPTPGNNTATDGGVNLLNPTVDLGVSKTGPVPALVVAGVPFNFNIRASNTGTTGFTGDIVLTDNIPLNMTINSYTLNGWSCSPAAPVAGPAAITCTLAATSVGVNGTTPALTMTAVVSVSGAFNNSVQINTPNCNLGAGNCGDGDTANYGVTSSVGVNSADISLLKSVDLANVPAGDVLTYTLEIVNAGPVTSNTVVLNDTLTSLINNTVGPTGAGYIGQTVNPGVATDASCSTAAFGSNGRQLTCNFDTIPVCTPGGNCPTVTVRVRPGGDGGVRSNTANTVSNGTADPNHGNETATADNIVDPRADMRVTKNASSATVPAGQNLTYVIAALNDGPSRADNVVITDTLPLNVTFVSAVPSSGTCGTTPGANVTTTGANNVMSCALGSVNNGAQSTVTVVVRPNTVTNATTLTNAVSVATSTTETNGGNNTATVDAAVSVPVLDLVLNKHDSVDPLLVGDNVDYIITVQNKGPSTAENVVVTDTLPTSILSYQSVTSSAGTCPVQPAINAVGGVVSCNLGSILANTTATITVTMKGVAKGSIVNNATVTSTETGLGFEDTGNNTVAETTTVRTKVDMEVVSKTPSVTPVNLRENFNFIVKVRNNVGAGLAEADLVEVEDILPSGMELTGTPTVALVAGTVTSSTCTGAAGATSFTCALGTVSLGGEVDITVPVQLVAVTSNPQVFNNTASVLTSSLDINGGSSKTGGNNFNSGSVTVNSSSIAGRVFRDFNNDGAVNGSDNGIAGIIITLTGTTFDGVAVSRNLPTDASGNYIFTGLPQGTYSVTEGTVTDINLADGKDSAGTAGGNATAVNDQTSGINLPSNTAATGYLFAERPIPRIGLAKSAGAVTNNLDGTYSVIFTLTVTNAGATPLTNVQIKDSIDVGGAQSLGTFTTNPLPAAGQYIIEDAPSIVSQTNGASLTVVSAGTFTGSGAGNVLLVPAASTLPNFASGGRSTATIRFKVRFFPTTAGPFENRAVADGTSPDGDPATDNSVDGPNPDPDGNGDPDEESPTQINLSGQTIAVAKALGTVVQTGPKRYKIGYSIIVGNPGTVTATNVQVTDNLSTTFPTAQTITIATPAAVSGCTGTVLTVASPAFTGIGQNKLLFGNQNLQAGERCTITFTTEVDFGTSALPNGVLNNQAIATTSQSPGGTVIATDLSNDGTTLVPVNNDPTPVDFSSGALSSVSGKVWRDFLNHNRIDDEGPTARVPGFIVEVLNAAGQIVGSAITDANGTYTISNLFPSDGTPATDYSVRFRDPASGSIYGIPASQDTNPTRNGTISKGVITGLQLAPGVNTQNQNLPLDPSGVVYDSVSRLPVPGAQVTLLFGGTPVPGFCLVGAQNTQVTGVTGDYQYLLLNPIPPGCPGNGIYTIQVVQPGGYLPPVSTIIPPPGGTFTPGPAPGVDAIQAQPGPPTGAQPTTYFFSFNLDIANSRNVVNNHIPLDPATSNSFLVSKTGNKSIIELGDTILYTVQARLTNGVALAESQLVDNLPAGFKYIPGSAKIAKGAAVAVPLDDPAGSPGPQLIFQMGAFNSLTPVTVTYRVRAGVGAMQGDGINRVQGRSPFMSSNVAQFKVKVTGGVFTDLACVAGKVFVDCNTNHIQDSEEVGIPGVRLYMEDGTYFITDAEGKYSYCGLTPRTHVLKADSFTLPRGSRLTTTSNRNVGDANSIFLDVKNGELIRADFAEGSCSNTVMEQVKARRTQGGVRAPETEKKGAPALKFEGKAANYPKQGTDSANQILVKPRGGGGDSSADDSANKLPGNTIPGTSGSNHNNQLKSQKGSENAN